MRTVGLRSLVLCGAVAMALADVGSAAAQAGRRDQRQPPRSWSQGETRYTGAYFSWQQSYDGRIFAWMSASTYQQYATVGYGTQASGPFTVTAGNVVYRGSGYGQSSAQGLLLVELWRPPPTPPGPPDPPKPPPARGCPAETYWNVYVQADAGYNYQFKVVVRANGNVDYALWSGEKMTWVEATGRVSGNRLSVTSVATVTDDRNQVVKVGGTLNATLSADCREGVGRTEGGRAPGARNDDGNIRVERYG